MGESTNAGEMLERGRAAFDAQAWTRAFEALSAADGVGPVGPEDLERLAIAAYLTGRSAEAADAWTRAHHDFLARGEVQRGVRCSYWLGITYTR